MLSYDWWKILALAFALIFSWALIFSTTATKIIPSQRFVITNYIGNITIQQKTYNNLNAQLQDGKLTHEIIEVKTLDLAADKTTGNTILEAYAGVNDLDLMFVSTLPDNTTAYREENEEGELVEKYTRNYLQTFTYAYGRNLFNLSRTDEDGYFKSLERYLNGYYSGGYESGEGLDEEKIEADFRARAKGDKRYKKKAQIEKGVQGEIERVKKYRAALLAFDKLLNSGRIEIVNTPQIWDDGTDRWQGKGNFSINICKTAEDSALLSKYVAYNNEYEENGKTVSKISALNMHVCLFNSNGEEESHRYEGLVYLTNFLSEVYA